MKDGKCVGMLEIIRHYLHSIFFYRDFGPTMRVTAMGDKVWHFNGLLHREEGPAVEYDDGDKRWFLNGVEYTEEEFKEYKLIEKLAGLK